MKLNRLRSLLQPHRSGPLSRRQADVYVSQREAVGIHLAELAAERAAREGGGGSPIWGGSPPGPGEELCLAIEVARALREKPERFVCGDTTPALERAMAEWDKAWYGRRN